MQCNNVGEVFPAYRASYLKKRSTATKDIDDVFIGGAGPKRSGHDKDMILVLALQ